MVGIIGGLGPLATAYFMKIVIEKTDAKKDQDHVDMIVFNHATIPDRTAYILGKSDENPEVKMIEDAKMLEKLGVSFIVMPCNTAHYFYDNIQAEIKIKVINIIEETILAAIDRIPNLKKIGILATDGTILTNSYQKVCQKYNLNFEIPDISYQKSLMNIIYNQVKAGNTVDIKLFMEIMNSLKEKGCEAIALGCTELSIIREDFKLYDNNIVDSLDILARKTITLSGKKVKEEIFSEIR